jgi:hypothetical protein
LDKEEVFTLQKFEGLLTAVLVFVFFFSCSLTFCI